MPRLKNVEKNLQQILLERSAERPKCSFKMTFILSKTLCDI